MDAAARTYHLRTFGCQMNDYDSQKIARLLEGCGYRSTDDPAQADFILINTCSIRETAEIRTYGDVGRLKPYKEANPALILAVAGCVAQQEKERLGRTLPYVDLILGTQQIQELPRLIAEIETERCRRIAVGWRKEDTENRFFDVLPAEHERRVTQPVTVIEGCDKVCTFCIVPYVRGRELSRPMADVVRHVEKLAARGVREVTLLGQNVNSYGQDLGDGSSFSRLLHALCGVKGIDRLRFTSSHPRDFGDDVIEAMASQPKICNHLHLPVQSGSDAVLARMKRGYTLKDYRIRVEALRRAIPDLRLTTDLIVGFPGETEADFRATMDLIAWAPFDSAFSFKFSPRPGTAAARYEDDVPDAIKQARLEALQTRIRSQSDAFMARWVGSALPVLVEDMARRGSGDMMGRTEHNLIVNFPGTPDGIGQMRSIRITRAGPNSFTGQPAERHAA